VAARLRLNVLVVSNSSRPIRPPGISNVRMVLVGDSADAADDRIAEHISAADAPETLSSHWSNIFGECAFLWWLRNGAVRARPCGNRGFAWPPAACEDLHPAEIDKDLWSIARDRVGGNRGAEHLHAPIGRRSRIFR
jgi:hypothetical protein